MKQRLIFLISLGCFCILSAALAFKANKDICKLYFHDPNDTRRFACTKLTLNLTLSPNGLFVGLTTASIAPVTNNCPVVSIYGCQ